MSIRPKAFLQQAKSKKKSQQVPETVDEFQAVGVDFEDAAGKWRAGDPVKSMRFFQRALDTYEQGLTRYPHSFDLAYNKARVQLEVAIHPLLRKHLDVPVIQALKTAYSSHEYALHLDQTNADTLFNTAQVLTTIAEEIANDGKTSNVDALQPLQEALDLLNRCLSIQEQKFQESIQDQELAKEDATQSISSQAAATAEPESYSAPSQSRQEEQEQWVSIIEPVTEETLLDTMLAQLGTLTTLCGILCSLPAWPSSDTNQDLTPLNLSWIEIYSTEILMNKIPRIAQNKKERHQEIALAKANFTSSILEAGFRSAKVDLQTYKAERDRCFAIPELRRETDFDASMADARSLIALNLAISETTPTPTNMQPTTTLASSSSSPSMPSTAQIRWDVLTTALKRATTASRLPMLSAEDNSKTHLLRADISLLQYNMGLPPLLYGQATSNAPQLLKNAEVFYRNASKLSTDGEDKAVAGLRSAVASSLESHDDRIALSGLLTVGRGREWVLDQLEEMVGEGLIPSDLQIT